ncbi:hypothetical protein ACA910_018955 [Epithemia clementina (nom. ined.)]
MKTPEKPVVNSFLTWDSSNGASGNTACTSINHTNNNNNTDDDECSVSSTVSVENPPKAEPLSPSSSSSSLTLSISSYGSCCEERPRVRFDESHNRWYDNGLYAEEECVAYWYTGEEYHNFKSAVSFMAKMIDRAEGGGLGGYGGGMNSSCLPSRDPLSYTGILESVYEAGCQMAGLEEVTSSSSVLTPTQEMVLRNLFSMEIGLGRLGLERRSVRTVSKDKSRRRCDLLELVEHNSVLTEDELARQCEAISLASRLFARHLAQAHFWSSERSDTI